MEIASHDCELAQCDLVRQPSCAPTVCGSVSSISGWVSDRCTAPPTVRSRRCKARPKPEQ
jgi:hypothetical protein